MNIWSNIKYFSTFLTCINKHGKFLEMMIVLHSQYEHLIVVLQSSQSKGLFCIMFLGLLIGINMQIIGMSRLSKSPLQFDFKVTIQFDSNVFSSALLRRLYLDLWRSTNLCFYVLTTVIYFFKFFKKRAILQQLLDLILLDFCRYRVRQGNIQQK